MGIDGTHGLAASGGGATSWVFVSRHASPTLPSAGSMASDRHRIGRRWRRSSLGVPMNA